MTPISAVFNPEAQLKALLKPVHHPDPLHPADVAFDAAVLYTLCRLSSWPGVAQADIDAARRALLQAPLSGAGAQLVDLAGSGMPEAIIPFKRDKLDVRVAALMSQEGSTCVFGSAGVQVDAGYFRIGRYEVRYLDEVNEERLFEPTLLDPSLVMALLERLLSPPPRPARYWVPGPDEGEVLRIIGPLVKPCLGEDRTPKLRLWVYRPDDPQRGAVAIGEVVCAQQGLDLVVQTLSPEVLMELQAAALEGAWLRAEHRGFTCFGPLPDLLEPGDGRDIWWHPSALLEDAVGVRPIVPVRLAAGTAQRILARVPWAWVHDASEFYAVAQRSPNRQDSVAMTKPSITPGSPSH